ncbi:TetR/AcrR family transcriptional regulator [Yoonia sp. R2331]|uniref:TetR/AcrR family transcriptional regulator n=1 Tax=Yoonia sp. R2331 TaxID=3237238 RepID=UPI0034E47018
MNEKTINIIKAAHAQFSRYGFGKTTMNDIASAANVARQTVYNTFSSKEEILRAVVRLYGEESLNQIKAAWASDATLDAKLSTFQKLGPQTWYEAIHAAPDWAELLEGMHTAAAEEMAELEVLWKAELTSAFADALGPAPKIATPLDDIVEFFYSSSFNAKYGAADAAHLDQRLRTIKSATLALIKAPAGT